MTGPRAFLNGQWVPVGQARLAVNDAGFVYGATATDLVRTFRHRLYRWPDHLARFRQSCSALQIEVAWDDAAMTRHAEELVESNARLIPQGADLALVLAATPGPIGFYLGETTAVGERPTLVMHTFPLPFARYRPWIESGVTLVTPNVRQVPGDCVDPRIKHRSRLHWWLADVEVRRAHPGAQALLLDQADCVTETASANFLLVREGRLISPPVQNVLGGISLQVVTELAQQLGMTVEYRDLPLAECAQADEALLTCTSYCLAGVRRLNDRVLAWPGPTLQKLLAAWNEEVGLDIHGQIRNAPA